MNQIKWLKEITIQGYFQAQGFDGLVIYSPHKHFNTISDIENYGGMLILSWKTLFNPFISIQLIWI